MSGRRIPAPMRPGQGGAALARWCDRHGRWECTKPRSRGRGQCHAQAITGTDACPTHCGKTVERARQDALTAWAAALGDGLNPYAAVAAQLALAWRRAGLLGGELRKQVEAGGADAAGGLVGNTWGAHASAGGVYATGERPRALVELERTERELVVKFAETAHRMGLVAYQARMSEAGGLAVALLLERALERAGVEPGPELGAALAAELRELELAGGAEMYVQRLRAPGHDPRMRR